MIEPGARERESLRELLEMARREDLGDGDVTSSLLPPGEVAHSRFVARDELVFCGGKFLADIAAAYHRDIVTTVLVKEGQRVQTGGDLAHWDGPAAAMMSAERVALNFLQRLSGVATKTAGYVRAVEGTGASIYDTRKTTPGWRELEKYAVRVGGGRNHRQGLYDAVMFKDNHLAVMSRLTGQDPVEAVRSVLGRLHKRRDELEFVMLEVDTLDDLAAALKLPVDIILLDNMSPEQMRQGVALRDRAGMKGRIALEASGGITNETLLEVAETGVERISVGALTHSAESVDIGLDTEFD